jgi:acetaldehyde dehydrogenase (acetylating)
MTARDVDLSTYSTGEIIAEIASRGAGPTSRFDLDSVTLPSACAWRCTGAHDTTATSRDGWE